MYVPSQESRPSFLWLPFQEVCTCERDTTSHGVDRRPSPHHGGHNDQRVKLISLFHDPVTSSAANHRTQVGTQWGWMHPKVLVCQLTLSNTTPQGNEIHYPKLLVNLFSHSLVSHSVTQHGVVESTHWPLHHILITHSTWWSIRLCLITMYICTNNEMTGLNIRTYVVVQPVFK